MNFRRLGCTNLNVSVLSFGASSLGGVFHDTDDDAGIRAVRTALDLGINFIDVSPYYGKTRAESVLGRALKGIPRDRYILATKVGQYDDGVFDFSAERVVRSLDESCSRLGVEYVDLLQCHDIEFANLEQIVGETLPALVKLRQEGRIGHVGITGLPLSVLRSTIERAAPGVVDTILSFCHYELNDNSLTELLPLCHERDIGVISAAPTGMGLLTLRGVPSWHPAPPAIVEGCRKAVEFCRDRGVDIVKLAVQFSVAHPGIATTLIGTASPENIRKNVAWAMEEPDFELIGQVLALLRPIHNHNFNRGRLENRDPIIA
jgi:L-galactose dehydrogenase